MLLDNKTKTEDSDHYKVFDFIKNYTESGGLDLVTGFFSVNALALMKDDINQAEKFRLILGNLMQDEAQLNKVIEIQQIVLLIFYFTSSISSKGFLVQ